MKIFNIKKMILIIAINFSSLAFAAAPAPAQSKQAMVVTTQHLATQVGVHILKQGGNAIDAAVAIGYALAVVEPCCGNIGGGGFMLIHLAKGENIFISFREKAPLNISQKLYFTQGKLDPNKIRKGYLAVGIPGTVMGLNYALKNYGSMSLKKVIQPSINLAKNGFKLNQGDINFLQKFTKKFQPQANVAAIFLKDNKPYQVDDILKQKDLAKTLTLIQQHGDKAFYHGAIAKAMVKASDKYGGVFTLKDFQNYSIQSLKPIVCDYHGYKIISAPPPSSGGITLCLMLNILKTYPLSQLGFNSATSAHHLTEAMRYAYAARNQYLGDPDFVTMPIQTLLSEKYAQQIRKAIKANKAGDSEAIGFKHHPSNEKPQTTSYAVIDKYGNAVEVTYTLNGYFGTGEIAGNTGFFLNNEMDDFTLQPGIPNMFGLIQGDANAIAPGKRPLSSMTPTILTKNNKVFMVVGAAGGSTIITQVLATILNVIDYHMNIQEAIDAPRFHMQWLPDVLYMEPYAFSKDTQAILENMGYKLQTGSPFKTRYWGATVGILQKNGILYGAVDSRRPAALAQGY